MATAALGQGITGTAHDFSGRGWNTAGEICVVCHTPHNANTTDSVLWNHELTAATFTMYTAFALDRTDRDAQSPELGGPSKLCLSCHDGTIAIDNYGPAGTSTDFITGDKNLTTDLSDDHPIGIKYPDATSGIVGYHDASLITPLKLTNWAGEDRVECSSCHEPHNDSYTNFLRLSNAGSALCLKCHDK